MLQLRALHRRAATKRLVRWLRTTTRKSSDHWASGHAGRRRKCHNTSAVTDDVLSHLIARTVAWMEQLMYDVNTVRRCSFWQTLFADCVHTCKWCYQSCATYASVLIHGLITHLLTNKDISVTKMKIIGLRSMRTWTIIFKKGVQKVLQVDILDWKPLQNLYTSKTYNFRFLPYSWA